MCPPYNKGGKRRASNTLRIPLCTLRWPMRVCGTANPSQCAHPFSEVNSPSYRSTPAIFTAYQPASHPGRSGSVQLLLYSIPFMDGRLFCRLSHRSGCATYKSSPSLCSPPLFMPQPPRVNMDVRSSSVVRRKGKPCTYIEEAVLCDSLVVHDSRSGPQPPAEFQTGRFH